MVNLSEFIQNAKLFTGHFDLTSFAIGAILIFVLIIIAEMIRNTLRESKRRSGLIKLSTKLSTWKKQARDMEKDFSELEKALK